MLCSSLVYSLGASLVKIAAVDIYHNLNITDSVLYTYGSPYTGNKAFASHFNEILRMGLPLLTICSSLSLQNHTQLRPCASLASQGLDSRSLWRWSISSSFAASDRCTTTRTTPSTSSARSQRSPLNAPTLVCSLWSLVTTLITSIHLLHTWSYRRIERLFGSFLDLRDSIADICHNNCNLYKEHL